MTEERPAEIVVVTHFASPYQLELFDKVEEIEPGATAVYYLHRAHPTRDWRPRDARHRARYFSEEPGAVAAAGHDLRSAPFAVFNYYAERPVPALMRIRESAGLPWAYWGERLGYRHPHLGRLARRWRLRHLHAGSHPIWGIGKWAVESYRREFGATRAYVNLPYFSDLERFSDSPLPGRDGPPTFLYSGSLSVRKGVDLLARAFRRLSDAGVAARLAIMGSGPLEGDMRAALRGCRNPVEWVGFRDWAGLPQVYASANFLCVPSRHDGWGLVVPEGLASGLPVIATNRTGAALDLLEPGTNGWIVGAGSEGALLDAMRAAAAMDGDPWHRMSRDARESVSRHTLAEGARRFLAAARSMSGAPGGGV